MIPFPPTNQDIGSIKYICSRPFQSQDGQHWPGETVNVKNFPDVQLLVQSGFLIPYSPKDGYDYLPPHLWTYTHLRQEAQAIIDGDPSATRGAEVDEKVQNAPVMKESLAQAEQQENAYKLLRQQSALNVAKAEQRVAARHNEERSVEEVPNKKVTTAQKKAASQTEARVSSGAKKADSENVKSESSSEDTKTPAKKVAVKKAATKESDKSS